MRISDWSSDVCSSDLIRRQRFQPEERAKRMADLNERAFVVAELPSLPEIAEIRRVAAQRRAHGVPQRGIEAPAMQEAKHQRAARRTTVSTICTTSSSE